ncbi:MAG: 16S rRNA (adenine(1518)-N(6)/adenine(1519)-N(6))-dimethyltransferase RsmA [Gammaproteobacteria bacterium]|nr:16S rRNA (adenine(1518)-N(6)/adenine(1519)-N(6))-dimethyltransferase RsmA [Gammaproteobacteria bacterium]MCW5583282.1 16S rRNA (adenine(1518)-N(6)/adenine(1519)-N(6))-dimethyltransferase RsmA [Gammaproteobacteria bacterium]
MTLIPRKRFGQHFLRDPVMIQQIIAALAPKPSEHLLEIGPGLGALTMPVLRLVKSLEVIELDRDLIPELQARSQSIGHLHVYAADALKFDFSRVKKDDRLLRVFGNLPYNISTPLIFHLISFADIFSDMLFMLQKEVAERLAATTATEHYGRLSVMAQYHCQVDLLFDVPPSAFDPPPKVQSSMVRLTPYQVYPYRAKDYVVFESMVKQAFGQRRKTLRNSLKGTINDEMWEQLSIRSNLRAEDLSVKDFVEMSNACF